MKWSYKTVHFELKREGLLGGSFLDETEVEEQLNQYGRSGWELISVIEVQDGIIAFFKQQLDPAFSAHQEETVEYDDHTDQVIDEPYEADPEEFYEPEDDYQMPEQSALETVRHEEQDGHAEAHEFEEYDADDHLIPEDGEDELLVDDGRAAFEDQQNIDEQDEQSDQRGIGAIRIE